MRVSTQRHRNTRGQAGFTLIEILLTLLIVSGIMVTITQILSAARVSRDTIHNIQETQLAGPAIMDMLERDIRGLVVHARTREQHLRVLNKVVANLDGDRIDFATTTDGLVLFSSDTQDRFLRGDVNEVGYCLRPSVENDDFLEIYRREQFGVDEDPFEGGQFTFLHDRVRSFDILVFQEDGPDAEPVEEWGTEQARTSESDGIGLPVSIEVTLVLEMAPRVLHEAIRVAHEKRRTIEYKRIIRFPEILRFDEEEIPVLAIPTIPEAAADPATGGAAGTNPEIMTGTSGGGGGGGRSGGPGGGGGTGTITATSDGQVIGG